MPGERECRCWQSYQVHIDLHTRQSRPFACVYLKSTGMAKLLIQIPQIERNSGCRRSRRRRRDEGRSAAPSFSPPRCKAEGKGPRSGRKRWCEIEVSLTLDLDGDNCRMTHILHLPLPPSLPSNPAHAVVASERKVCDPEVCDSHVLTHSASIASSFALHQRYCKLCAPHPRFQSFPFLVSVQTSLFYFTFISVTPLPLQLLSLCLFSVFLVSLHLFLFPYPRLIDVLLLVIFLLYTQPLYPSCICNISPLPRS